MKRVAVLLTVIAVLFCSCETTHLSADRGSESLTISSNDVENTEASETKSPNDIENTENSDTASEETNNSVIENTETGSSSAENSGSDAIAEYSYLTLEQLISHATDIIKAKYVGFSIDGDAHLYTFEVIETVRGMETEKTITVRSWPSYCYVVGEGISFSTYNLGYESEKEYILFLKRSTTVYEDGYSLSFVNSSLIIPLNDSRECDLFSNGSMLYGQPLSKHFGTKSFADAISNGKFEQYAIDAVKNNPMAYGDDYIKSNDMVEVLRGSDFVLEVLIEYIYDNTSFADDRLVCDCSIVSVFKGEINVKKDMFIFPSGNYLTGEKYIVAVNIVDNSSIFTMSSKNSVFSTEQREEIISILSE